MASRAPLPRFPAFFAFGLAGLGTALLGTISFLFSQHQFRLDPAAWLGRLRSDLGLELTSALPWLLLGLLGCGACRLFLRRRPRSAPGTDRPERRADRSETPPQLRESLSGFLHLLQCAHDAIVPIDHRGTIRSWNAGAQAVFGYRREEILGAPLTHLIQPACRNACEQLWTRLQQVGWSQVLERTLELQGQRKDGTAFPLELLLTTWKLETQTFHGCILRDLSERKQAEEKITNLAKFPAEDPLPVLRLHRDGTLLYANPASRPLLEAWKVRTGQPVPDFWRQRAAQACRAGTRTHLELELKGRELLFVLAPVHGTDYLNVYGQDLTERKRAEKRLQEVNARLEEAVIKLERAEHRVHQERLHALGQMASGIAHDFNNALSPVLGYCELLLTFPDLLADQAQTKQYLGLIHTAARDAAQIVRRLREFYRERDAEEAFLPVNANRLIEEVISLSQPKWKNQAQAAGQTITLQADLQEVPLLCGQSSELREALTNLIFNAADAMPGGGTLTLRTRAQGSHVILEVQDTGEGMTEEVRQRCLEPFFSTKGENGTGLGLAMVFGIVKRHQGTIDVQSRPGAGTCVTLRLPAHAAAAPVPPEPDSPPESAAEPPRSILIVDDDPHVRQVLTAYLAGDGHRVQSAVDASEALQQFTRGSFDLVITDQAMPGMNGEQLATELKRRRPEQPVFLLTGFGDALARSGAELEGIDQLLSKPISLQGLRRAVASAAA